MQRDEDFAVIDQIAEISRKINTAAEEAAGYVSKVEKRLLEAEAGVVVWDAELVDEEMPYQPSKDEPAVPAKRKVTFGFSKVKSKWGFAVREEFFTKSTPAAQEFTEPAYAKISLLRKADRDLRILAAEHVPTLLDKILGALNEKYDRLVPEPAEEVAADAPAPAEDKPAEDKPAEASAKEAAPAVEAPKDEATDTP